MPRPHSVAGLTTIIEMPRGPRSEESCCEGACAKCGAKLSRPDSQALGLCPMCSSECPKCGYRRIRLTANKVCDECEIADLTEWNLSLRKKIERLKREYAAAKKDILVKAGLLREAPPETPKATKPKRKAVAKKDRKAAKPKSSQSGKAEASSVQPIPVP